MGSTRNTAREANHCHPTECFGAVWLASDAEVDGMLRLRFSGLTVSPLWRARGSGRGLRKQSQALHACSFCSEPRWLSGRKGVGRWLTSHH